MSEVTPHIQDCVAFLAITSKDFLGLVRPYLDPKLLPSEVTYKVVTACFDYFDTTRDAPKDHICDALDYTLKASRPETIELCYNFLDRITMMKPPNVDYVFHRLSEFIRSRTFEIAAVEFVKMIDQGEIEGARLLMSNALHAGLKSVETGVEYFTDKTTLYADLDDSIMPIGIEGIDKWRKGLSRGEFAVWLAGPKGKKTWSLVHLGTVGLMRGLNVAYYSFECSEKELAVRFDRAIGSLKGLDKRYKQIPRYFFDPASGLVKSEMIDRPCITDTTARKNARKVLERFGGRLFLKKFPMGSKTILDVEAHLNELERFQKFVPDLLITDYGDIMKPIDAFKPTRDQINETYIHHKRIADERAIISATASQSTRQTIYSKVVNKTAAAEDIRKVANCDIMWSTAQTEPMKEQSIGIVRVVAARIGVEDIVTGVVTNLDMGQMYSESFPYKLGIQLADVPESEENE